jgi:dihydrofolate synthase/folylpolyglutamate synthase
MGGRLDATNIVDPLLSIITDISLDHMEWLGPTISDIAREKAGILRKGGTLITLPQHPEANQVLGEVASSLSVLGVSAVPYMPPTDPARHEAQGADEKNLGGAYSVEALGQTVEVASPLRGAHQHRNVSLAIAAAVELAISHGFPITGISIAQGIHNTLWPGRLECITIENPDSHIRTDFILDVAHNPAGAWALRAGLREIVPDQQLGPLVFSCLRDKPVLEIAQILFPIFNEVIFAPIQSTRAMPMRDLLAAAAATNTPSFAASSISQAVDLAFVRSATPRAGKTIVISGSVYLVGEARSHLLARIAQSAASNHPEERVGQTP